MKVPGFLLRRLYLKGSLKHTAEGFQFQLRNQLGSGYARRFLPLTVDGQEIDMASTTFEVNGKWTTFAQVSPEAPFTLAMNKTTTIQVSGPRLAASPHTVGVRFEVAGLGVLAFDFTDVPADGS